MDFQISVFQADYVKKLTDNFTLNLLESVIIVSAVIIMVLGKRIGTLVAAIIPIVMCLTFEMMNIFKIYIDKISLTALIISLGMLVDNAIVVSEAILVKISQGETKSKAILDATKELFIPLLIASIATTCAFLPIYLAKSASGEYCSSLFKVIGIALLSSWFLAFSAIPVFCQLFLNISTPTNKKTIYNTNIYEKYEKFLRYLIENPKKTFQTIGIFMLVSFSLFYFFVPKIFFPASERQTLQIELEAPQGTDIKTTEKMVYKLENYFKNELLETKNKKGITDWSAYIGQGFPRYVLAASPEPQSPNYAGLIVNVSSDKIVNSMIEKIRAFGEENFADSNFYVTKVPIGPPFKAPVEIRITGDNTETLFEYATEIESKLATMKGTEEINNDWGIKTQRIIIKVKQEEAFKAAISNNEIASALQSNFSGATVGQYREGDDIIPIVYRNEENFQNATQKINTINIYSPLYNSFLPLNQIADIEIKWQYPEIKRRNRKKVITIQSQLKSGYTANQVIKDIKPWLENYQKTWEYGNKYEIGGSNEKSRKSTNAIYAQIPLSAFIILFLMMIQFNSFKKIGLIFLNSLFSLFGGFLGLFLTHSSFSFITFLGTISLFGIIANNGLILIDKINKETNSQNNLKELIINSAKMRLRPIVIAASTTILGLLPLWIGQDPMFSSLAVVMIFGLLSGIFFTLFILPISYFLTFKNSH